MSISNVFAVLGGVSATVSAVAAARSAKLAASASQPFVISNGISHSSNSSQLTTSLVNAGPGMAIDVRFRVAGSDWSRTLDAVPSGGSLPCSATDVTLEQRWKQPNAQAIVSGEIAAALVTVEFTGLDGTRWRTLRHGNEARTELQRLTPRHLYWWRKIDGSS